MLLKHQDLLKVYTHLHRIFPDDLRVARMLIQMVKDDGDEQRAMDLCMAMANRMLALGRGDRASTFLALTRQLNVEIEDAEEIDTISTIANLTQGSPAEDDLPSDSVGKTFQLLDQLTDQETLSFLSHANIQEIGIGAEVIKQGEVEKTFYLILDGELQVHVGDKSDKVEVNRLQLGDFFGEFACLYNLPRSATVTATKASTLLEFSQESIFALMAQSPLAGERLARTIQKRLILSICKSHPAFQNLEEEDANWMAEESAVFEFQEGATAYHQGEDENHLYIIMHGTLDAYNTKNEKPLSIRLTINNVYGDLHHYTALPNHTKLEASERSLVCKMPKKIFTSFLNAYGPFAIWMEEISERRRKNAQLLSQG